MIQIQTNLSRLFTKLINHHHSWLSFEQFWALKRNYKQARAAHELTVTTSAGYESNLSRDGDYDELKAKKGKEIEWKCENERRSSFDKMFLSSSAPLVDEVCILWMRWAFKTTCCKLNKYYASRTVSAEIVYEMSNVVDVMICLQTPCQVTTFRISNFRSFHYRASYSSQIYEMWILPK